MSAIQPSRIPQFLSCLLAVAGFASAAHADLWDNPDREQAGWKEFGWYGWIHDAGNGWIYHTEHGWTYAAGADPSSIWFYDQEMGWIWSAKDFYPFIYPAGARGWLYYIRGTTGPRTLYDYATGSRVEVLGQPPGPVGLTAGTYDWRHREYFETEDHQLINWTRNVVTTSFETKVLENDLLRVTLLPGWGARILSILYKPFNIELLSYAKGDKFSDIIYTSGAFYYDNWLLLPGGINPTFPEGEHGKYWGVPWDFSVVSETADAVTVRMSKTDDFEWSGHPGKFNNGVTGLVADMDITLRSGSACIEIAYTLTNPRSELVPYEFWMAASLAPLPPDQTATSGNLEIVMSQEKLLLRDWWNWMKQTETDDGTPGNDVYLFDKLAWLYNWKGSGIAYCYPGTDNPWWGVINHDNLCGVLRTADDASVSPGMKIWGTGANYGMFELWSGHSQEFFVDAFMAPNEVKRWKEYFIPTVDLPKVSFANRYGAADARHMPGQAMPYFLVSIYAAVQPANWRVEIFARDGQEDPSLLDSSVLSFSPEAPTQHFHSYNVPTEAAYVEAVVTDFFTGEERMRFEIR